MGQTQDSNLWWGSQGSQHASRWCHWRTTSGGWCGWIVLQSEWAGQPKLASLGFGSLRKSARRYMTWHDAKVAVLFLFVLFLTFKGTNLYFGFVCLFFFFNLFPPNNSHWLLFSFSFLKSSSTKILRNVFSIFWVPAIINGLTLAQPPTSHLPPLLLLTLKAVLATTQSFILSSSLPLLLSRSCRSSSWQSHY